MLQDIQWSNPRSGARGYAIAVAALAALTGCVSSRGTEMAPAGSPAVAVADSAATAETNRRILEAAARDKLQAPDAGVSSDYVIGVGDVTDINVFGVESLSGSFRVGEDGQIALPLLGPVRAEGSTARELEDSLQARLRATYMKDPHVTVQISEMQSHGVSVLGAVRSPGVYQIAGRSTVLDVLAMAQGLTEEAGQTVLVVRDNGRRASVAGADSTPAPAPVESAQDLARADSVQALGPATPLEDADPLLASGPQGEIIQVDLATLLEPGGMGENVAVLPGDIVQVRPAGLVYVVGEVNRPGGFAIPPGKPMTVLQALALAQGLGHTAAASRSVIVHTLEDGSRTEVPVDIGDVLNGSIAPPELAAHDVLFVPNNGAKSFALGAVNALVRMVTLRGWIY